MTPGTLYGVGVGPGDPELLTVKAARLIEQTGTIAYPAANDGSSFARSIVGPYMVNKTELEIRLPMRTDRQPASEVYDHITDRIAATLDKGQDVVVLCEGDPFFYGSYMYLHARLCARFRCVSIPGVSSVFAAASASGKALVARNETFAVLPASGAVRRLEAALDAFDTVVVLKLGRHFEAVRDVLERLRLLSRTIYCERATLPGQLILAGPELPASAPYFSLLVVHVRSELWSGVQ